MEQLQGINDGVLSRKAMSWVDEALFGNRRRKKQIEQQKS